MLRHLLTSTTDRNGVPKWSLLFLSSSTIQAFESKAHSPLLLSSWTWTVVNGSCLLLLLLRWPFAGWVNEWVNSFDLCTFVCHPISPSHLQLTPTIRKQGLDSASGNFSVTVSPLQLDELWWWWWSHGVTKGDKDKKSWISNFRRTKDPKKEKNKVTSSLNW